MADYLIGTVDDFKEGEGRAFRAGQRTVAVFRVGERFYGIANRCMHKGANMCDGEITPDGARVRCPWHNWPFELETGRNPLDPSESMRTYEVRLEGKDVILIV